MPRDRSFGHSERRSVSVRASARASRSPTPPRPRREGRALHPDDEAPLGLPVRLSNLSNARRQVAALGQALQSRATPPLTQKAIFDAAARAISSTSCVGPTASVRTGPSARPRTTGGGDCTAVPGATCLAVSDPESRPKPPPKSYDPYSSVSTTALARLSPSPSSIPSG